MSPIPAPTSSASTLSNFGSTLFVRHVATQVGSTSGKSEELLDKTGQDRDKVNLLYRWRYPAQASTGPQCWSHQRKATQNQLCTNHRHVYPAGFESEPQPNCRSKAKPSPMMVEQSAATSGSEKSETLASEILSVINRSSRLKFSFAHIYGLWNTTISLPLPCFMTIVTDFAFIKVTTRLRLQRTSFPWTPRISFKQHRNLFPAHGTFLMSSPNSPADTAASVAMDAWTRSSHQ